jgi:hypothetical protein
MRKRHTKADVEQWCEERDIELTYEHFFGHIHVHVNINAPRKIFTTHQLHNLAVWDDTRSVNWDRVWRELQYAGYGNCTIEGCDVCWHNFVS